MRGERFSFFRSETMEKKPNKLHIKKKLSTFQIIILGFAGVILLGTLLLMLPISSRSGVLTPFSDALFTATSAVCVTGLVVKDTATYWSAFGQGVIITLIQIGGLGVVTVAATFALLSGRKIGLMQRSTMQEAMAAPKVGGIVRLTGFILRATLIVELAGALLLMPSFVKDFGLRGVWMSFFHSISAFCNAGFDLMGTPDAQFQSLASYAYNPFVTGVIMLLIILGGLGFLTWEDVLNHKWRFRKYRMQSKVILVTSAILIVVPAIIYFFLEYSSLPLWQRIQSSLFQAVTPRTAGFNTENLSALTGTGKLVMIILMLIGGSPGSTAGGMKTTTVAVLFSSAFATFRRKEDAHFFGRRVEHSAVRNAGVILVMYMTLCFLSAGVISAIEGLSLGDCLFETASAVGTVGLTLGITPKLSLWSRIILVALMFFGRVGGLTLIYAALSGKNSSLSKLPQEKITVG